jgi:hypothetical protein
MRSLSRILRSPRYRSLAGLIVALLVLPVLLGTSDCVTRTPVGDPERSRIDPRLTGIWLSDRWSSESAAEIWIFEPYDARTWLVTRITVKAKEDQAPKAAAPQPESAESTVSPPQEEIVETAPRQPNVDVLRILSTLRAPDSHSASMTTFKGWLATLGGQRFLVLEPRIGPSSKREFQSREWMPMRVQLQGQRLLLSLVKTDTDDLNTVTSRQKAEQIIARHAADKEFYDDAFAKLLPVPRAGYDDIEAIVEGARFRPMEKME